MAEGGEALLDGLLASADRERLMAHIGEFAKRVKLSGTAEELESFRYLEAEMRGFGYRTALLSHDAYISLPVSSVLRVDGAEIRSITHSMSRPTGAAGISAPLVYVGEGGRDDFAGRDVAGKIVLVDGIAVENVADLASRAGAIGEIHISPTEHLYEMCISPVWGSPSQTTRGHLPKTAVVTIPRDEGAALRARCLAGETVLASLQTEVDTGWRKTPLLVCDLDAPDGGADAPFVLFSGHHDTWHFGVMDNGGANATMLEAARLLAGARASWRRGLRVCFWSGHSHGRYSGSAWYADEYWAELDRRCAAHVNVDSTGAIGASVLTNSGVVDELAGLAREVIAAETGQVHAGRRQGRAADQSFWGVGIPSMFGSLSHQPPGPVKMLTALGWWWHTPHDLADKIDPDNLVRDTRIVLRTLWALLARPILPLDYVSYAEALQVELARIDNDLAGRFDIAPLRAAAEELGEAARIFGAIAAARADEARAGALDRVLMHASRHLVPINYTQGDRFRHDPAVPLPAWLALEPIRALAAEPPASVDLPFHAVDARQARNRVLKALKEATAELRSAQ
ncbi:M28 family peptidase [Chelatococcus sp. GCM10030263]|uniref:M28 family peptidase n=1 Tax=Chelatococcus sp. GCM10030263 TaxID=3273387 RepID=UPI0036123417